MSENNSSQIKFLSQAIRHGQEISVYPSPTSPSKESPTSSWALLPNGNDCDARSKSLCMTRSTTAVTENENSLPTSFQPLFKIDLVRLRSPPDYYLFRPRSTCTMTVGEDLSVVLVEQRLLDFLRRHSISYQNRAEDDSSTAPLRMECQTLGSHGHDYLTFVIQFWLVSPSWRPRQTLQQSPSPIMEHHATTNRYDRVLLLEVNRSSGTGAMEMQHIRQHLFQYLQTGYDPSTRNGNRKTFHGVPSNGRSHLAVWEMEDMSNLQPPYHELDSDELRLDALHVCLQMLQPFDTRNRRPGIDQVQLGLETLVSITNPAVVRRNDAYRTAQQIVLGTHPDGRRLQSALIEYCFGQATTPPPQKDQTTINTEDNVVVRIFRDRFHLIGLKTLDQALSLVVEGQNNPTVPAMHRSDFPDTSPDHDPNFWKLIVPILVSNMEHATERPHEASLSARCLRLWSIWNGRDIQEQTATSATPLRKTSTETESPRTTFQRCLVQAHQYGMQYHLSLEQESKSLLDMDMDHMLMSH